MGMAGIIQHNMLAAFGARNLGIVTDKNTKSAEKLSSGYKINRSADDAAGLSISEKMRRLIRGMDQGADNTMDGISFVQVADGAMAEVHSMLHRMNELAVQAANGTNSDSDREAINNEVEQLKAEINRIGETTMFNGETVFDQKIDPPSFYLTGSYFALEDINIYNATYDPATREVTYGGMMLKGERISWDSIDPSMVSVDTDGKQTFKGGEYTFSLSGENYKVVCKDGDEVPQLYREMTIKSMDLTSIWLGSERHSWSDFVDGDGVTLSADTLHSGEYTLRGTNQKINLFLGESDWNYATLGDVWQAKELGILDSGAYQVKEEWAKADSVKAVDAQGLQDAAGLVDTIINTETVAKAIINDSSDTYGISYKARAGKEEASNGDSYSHNGIWLEKWDDNQGKWTEVTGSLRSWEQVGLQDKDGAIWKSGTDIRDAVTNAVTYQYNGKIGNGDDTSVQFSFVLKADVTSLDSVICAIDDSLIISKDLKTSYEATLKVENDSNILSASLTNVKPRSDTNSLLNVQEEYDLGRIYENQTDNGVAEGAGAVNLAANTVTVSMATSTGHTPRTANASVEYTGDIGNQKLLLKNDVSKYIDYIKEMKINELINRERSLSKVVGNGNITMTGNLTETIDVDSTYVKTDLLSSGTYASAHIDFKDVSSIMDLVGTSFDATCATCDRHYSVKLEAFNNETKSKADADSNSTYNELEYKNKTLKYVMEHDGSNNYTLRIDLNSIREAGFTSPQEYTKAFVAIMSGKTGVSSTYKDSLDFHFNQYVANGTVLYIVDDRNSSYRCTGKSGKVYSNAILRAQGEATFSPRAYNNREPEKNVGEYTFNLNENSAGRMMRLSYKYDYSDIEDSVAVSMEVVDSANILSLLSDSSKKLYEKIDDGDGRFHYDEYRGTGDLSNVEGGKLYEISVKYSNIPFETESVNWNSNMTDINLVEQYTNHAITEMLEKSTIDFNATDFTKLKWDVEEKPNEAFTSKFTTTIWRDERQRQGSLKIHHSSELGDFTVIPKFTMNTFVLGIYGADCRTAEKATNTIRKLNKALEGLNTRRSLYGAYQNRLEHTYNRLQETKENTDTAESRIRDTDMAEEMVNQAKTNILQQAGQSMLAQANRSKEGILQLLQ